MSLKTHWHWGTRIAIVYVLFAAGTLGFVTFAMSRDVDLVSDDYYDAAIAYDSRQAAAERAIDLTTGVAITRDSADRTCVLSVSFPVAVRPQSTTVTLYRASDSRADRAIPVNLDQIDSAGRLRIPLDQLPAGPWTVQVAWTSAGRAFYVERRVVVP